MLSACSTVDSEEEFDNPDTQHAQVSWNYAVINVTPTRAVLRPRRSPLLRYSADTRRPWERIIAKGKWSCAHFPKKRRPTWVASRDPPLLSALPHHRPSATSCWLAARSRPTTRRRELAARRLKFPCPPRNLRWCNMLVIIS